MKKLSKVIYDTISSIRYDIENDFDAEANLKRAEAIKHLTEAYHLAVLADDMKGCEANDKEEPTAAQSHCV